MFKITALAIGIAVASMACPLLAAAPLVPATDAARRAFEKTLPNNVVIDYGPGRVRYGGKVGGKAFTRGECNICKLLGPGVYLIPADEATPANVQFAGRTSYYLTLTPNTVVDWGERPDTANPNRAWMRYGGRQTDGTPFENSDFPEWFQGKPITPPPDALTGTAPKLAVKPKPKPAAKPAEPDDPDEDEGTVRHLYIVPSKP